MKKSNLSWVAILAAMVLGACSNDENWVEPLPEENPLDTLKPVITGFEQNLCTDWADNQYVIRATITFEIKSVENVSMVSLDILDKNRKHLKGFLSIGGGETTQEYVYEDYLYQYLFVDGKTTLGLATSIRFEDGSTVYGDTVYQTLTYHPSFCTDNNHPHVVDLGLPSGTKWACCNVGSFTPEEYGGYYAWGEIYEKDNYEKETYAYYDSATGKYISIGSDIAGTAYDVAHAKWNGNWCMPTTTQMRELKDRCDWTWTTEGGHMGWRVTGVNGNYIFLPGAGVRSGSSHVSFSHDGFDAM